MFLTFGERCRAPARQASATQVGMRPAGLPPPPDSTRYLLTIRRRLSSRADLRFVGDQSIRAWSRLNAGSNPVSLHEWLLASCVEVVRALGLFGELRVPGLGLFGKLGPRVERAPTPIDGAVGARPGRLPRVLITAHAPRSHSFEAKLNNAIACHWQHSRSRLFSSGTGSVLDGPWSGGEACRGCASCHVPRGAALAISARLDRVPTHRKDDVCPEGDSP